MISEYSAQSQQDHLPALAQAEVYTTPESQAFWGQGFARPAIRFKEQIDYLKSSESSADVRPYSITARPIAITSSTYGSRSKLSFNEREGLLDLDNFTSTVIQQAESDERGSDSYAASQKMLAYARTIREESVYLGKQEYDMACFGIATAWQTYVAQSPDHILNIYAPNRSGEESHNKSYEVVLQDIVYAFHQLALPNPQISTRLRIGPESWRDTDAAKLVVVDDWAISGHTIKGNMQWARTLARNAGLANLADKAEAHLLVARGDYLLKGIALPRRKCTKW